MTYSCLKNEGGVCLDCLVTLCLQEGTMPQHLNYPGKQIVPLPAVTP